MSGLIHGHLGRSASHQPRAQPWPWAAQLRDLVTEMALSGRLGDAAQFTHHGLQLCLSLGNVFVICGVDCLGPLLKKSRRASQPILKFGLAELPN
jgi:MFS transporter, BCD family, chlorophyll transporter